MSPNASKARAYIQQLDDARCDGRWDAIPELVRKVRKHAPDRTCLTLTAEIEQGIALATQQSAGTRPSTATTIKDLDIASQLPKLLSAIDDEHTFSEDKFQAQVCVGWLHWVAGEYNLAFVRLPKGIDNDTVDAPDNISEWTRVCALKAAYLRANCLARNEKQVEALAVFQGGIPSLSTTWTSQQARQQLRYWSELFLTEFCMLYTHCLEDGNVSLEDPNAMASFRSWARYWEGAKGAPLAGGYGFRGSVPRRRVWYEYYAALSTIVEQDSPYPTAYVPALTNESSARTQLRIEVKKVESIYEALLLSETDFPRANEEREEIEAFVKLVMSNWTIISGRGWREQDLGQGGRETFSRGVLDILYRASVRTFHSTAILRSLFTVHLAVAEFDLAFKAFDAWLELVKKGKARVEKTGHFERSLDDDGTALETISLCITALCRYGDRAAAEKARDLGVELEHWLDRIVSPPQNGGMGSVREEGGTSAATGDEVAPKVLALAWQSMGLAHAQWARMTYDSSSRAEIQTKAIRCLRKSLSSEFGGYADLRGVFALSFLLAEQRELTTAIELAKTALLSSKAGAARQFLRNGPYWQERALIPLWHLLSLLLSARQEFVMAARACEGAFEQFRDPAVLFGSENLYRSEHLNEAEAGSEKSEAGKGLVDEMDDFEKENILEIKMTQLAIIELLEGPKVAVNASLELLSLFGRLFGSLESQPKLAAAPKTAAAPKSSAGTLRSIKGSIFGSRSEKSARSSRQVSEATEKLTTIPSRPQTTQTTASTQAPTIQITKENGSLQETRTPRKSASTRRSESTKRNSLRKRDSSGSRRRAVSSGGVPHQPTVVDGESYFTPLGDFQSFDFFSFASKKRPGSSSQVPTLGRTLSHAESYLSNKSKTSEISGIAIDGVVPAGAILPVIQFSKEQEKRRRGTILVKVWLMIAGFYRRAKMLDDAKLALAEAQKLVNGMDSEAGKDVSTSGSSREVGWGYKKSVEELWGDVWAEMGALSLAREAPYAARSDFETALTHFPNHPAAIVGLSNILLDIYTEKLLPPPAVPALTLADGSIPLPGADPSTTNIASFTQTQHNKESTLPSGPLGLYDMKPLKQELRKPTESSKSVGVTNQESRLPPPYKATSIPIVDRIAARDRASGLLSGLTKLGTAWNYSEAWFTLARAHEESGQPDKAKEVLWWCVELEEGMGVRDWSSVGVGGYVL